MHIILTAMPLHSLLIWLLKKAGRTYKIMKWYFSGGTLESFGDSSKAWEGVSIWSVLVILRLNRRRKFLITSDRLGHILYY
uniref:Putative secreted protein n=1 Tax=Xenopsylla cheopis TaxID=163159 RepID=A0A6M2DZJ4_XENCH